MGRDINTPSIDYQKPKDNQSKISFEELVRNTLNDQKVDSKEAKIILERFEREKEDIIQNSKQALSDLKSNLGVIDGDIQGLKNKLIEIKNANQRNDRISSLLSLFEKKQYNSFNEINEEIKRQYGGKTFYEIMNTDDILTHAGITPEEFEKNYRNIISIIFTGISPGSFALYSAFAEEANFEYKDGKYQIQRFGGMNIPHRIALNNFNNMYTNVEFDSEGNIIGGIAKIKLDVGPEQSKMDLEINFNNNTITPEIFLSSHGKTQKINIQEIKDFIHLYTKVQNGYDKPLFVKNGDTFVLSEGVNPDAINILNVANDITTLVHEGHHALYSADPKYRELIHKRVRQSTEQQKKAALLAASVKYDIFDPDMSKVNKGIVIDEMFNAYYNDGSYDYKTMTSKITSFSLGALSKRYSLNFNELINSYSKIDDLPVSDKIKAELKNRNKGGNEKDFIKEEESLIMDEIGDMNIALNFIKNKYPDFYQRIENATKVLFEGI